MKKVYAIPGFGVDQQLFSRLNLDAGLQCINWLQPLQQESLREYAIRMAASIQEADAVLIGVSFGGMLAIEISKFLQLSRVIIISSAKTRSELPWYFRWAGRSKIYRILPVGWLQRSKLLYALANWRLGARSPEEKYFAAYYRSHAELPYVKWSMHQILNWQNQDYPSGLIHIHGDADHILPIRHMKPTHTIRGGTHMMVFNRAEEISALINQQLRQLPSA
ncbi:hypothetical protein GCM10027051_07370 [Niabella terrae]